MTEIVVLDTDLTLTPATSRGMVRVPFQLDAPADTLRIDFSYRPKEFADRKESLRLIADCLGGGSASVEGQEPARAARLEKYLPLVNLVTISLDHGAEYVGCAHRQDPVQRHLISARRSSLGFKAYPVSGGAYAIVISAHYVISPRCEVRLRVSAYDADPGLEP